MTATGGIGGAGIGGGNECQRQQCHRERSRSGDGDRRQERWLHGAGATIGSGGSKTPDGNLSTARDPGDISRLTTGYIHHIIYEQDGTTIKRSGGSRSAPAQPGASAHPEDPNAPAEESNEVDLGTPGLHVETLEGDLLPF